MEKNGVLIVVSGPSGVGKGSVLKELVSLKGIVISISATTRSPREFEKDGVDYYFISREKFKEYIEKNDMVEYNEYCGNLYGTIRSKLINLLKENEVVILEIDVNGASLISKSLDCVLVFLFPPSFEELKRRLINRGTEGSESVEKRLKQAFVEVKKADEYDYLIVNENIKKAAKDILTIARAESLKVKNQKYRIKEFIENEI